MYLAVIFGGKLPPKIAPKTKIAVIIVVNYYCKNGCSQRESNPQLAIRRRLLYPFNYENECRIFGLFSLFGIGNHIYESNHSRDEYATINYYRHTLPCIQILPLKRLPTAGSPTRFLSLINMKSATENENLPPIPIFEIATRRVQLQCRERLGL